MRGAGARSVSYTRHCILPAGQIAPHQPGVRPTPSACPPALLSGRFHYGTAFGESVGLADRVDTISQELVESGFSYSGKDLLYSGITGEGGEGRGGFCVECVYEGRVGMWRVL